MSASWFFELISTVTSNLVQGWRTVLDFLLKPLGASLRPLLDVPIVGDIVEWLSDLMEFSTPSGELVSLLDISVIQLIFGFMLPVLLGFTIAKWLLDLVN